MATRAHKTNITRRLWGILFNKQLPLIISEEEKRNQLLNGAESSQG